MATAIDINLIAARRAYKQRQGALLRLAVYSLGALVLCMALLHAWVSVSARVVRNQIAECQAELRAPELRAGLERKSVV